MLHSSVKHDWHFVHIKFLHLAAFSRKIENLKKKSQMDTSLIFLLNVYVYKKIRFINI